MRDRVITKCTKCNENIEITYRGVKSLLKTVKSITHKKCYSPNNETILKISNSSKNYWSKDESHKLASKIIKEKWKNKDYRNKVLNSLLNSETLKASLKISNSCINWSYSKRQKFTKNLWEKEDFKNNILSYLKGPMRINMINLWKNEDYRIKMSKTAFFIPKTSKLQEKLGKLLKELKINYVEEYKIKWWRFDYYLPEFNILIEVQGKYWHSKPDVITRDKKKRSFVKNNTDKKLYEVWEDEFAELEILKTKIINIIHS